MLSVSKRTLTRGVLFFCLGTELCLVFAVLFLNYLRWLPSRPLRKIFNLTREDSIGTWFSSNQTLCSGILLWLIFFFAQNGDSGKRRWGWAILAVFFTAMAVDDAAKIHERLGSAFQSSAWFASWGNGFLLHYPSYTWQLVVGPVFAILSLYTVQFLWRELDETISRAWIICALLFWAVAVLLDFVEGLDLDALSDYRVLHLLKVLEEFLEMLGNTFFLVPIFYTLLSRVRHVHLKFT